MMGMGRIGMMGMMGDGEDREGDVEYGECVNKR